MRTEIERYRPCQEAVDFRKQFNTFEEAWNACPRGDWMLWLASKLEVDKRKLTLAKALCAETVVHLMKDERSRHAVEVAKKYGHGNATDEELSAAADAAAYAAAVADAADTAAAYAVAADVYAAAAAVAAAYADAAADAAYAAAYADAAAMEANEQKTANVCRQILTNEVISKLRHNG